MKADSRTGIYKEGDWFVVVVDGEEVAEFKSSSEAFEYLYSNKKED